ncbi:MAG: NfeD family protein [Actinomycetota bacterium]|jgi:membrane protein implicated in regulation of membrane protease activity|nr:NfeD family protein [Actinomycetota bacterium]
MDVNSPETWRWIWLVAVVLFALAEVFTPVLFFMLSFALGAAAAAVAAFAGGGALVQWLLFVGVTAASLAALVPLGRRLEGRDEVHPVGANRWEGRTATVVTEIPAGKHQTGLVRIDRETWKAESTNGMGVPDGATVLVTHVTGTRLIVSPWRIDVAPRGTSPGRTEPGSPSAPG